MTTSTASLPVIGTLAPSRARTSGLVMAVASALAFSSSGPFIKPLLEGGWSLGAALVVRMGVAGLILSPALFLAIKRQRSFLRIHWRLLLAFGLIPVLGCQLFFFSAMQRMPVAVALLIQYLAPVMLVGVRLGAHQQGAVGARAVGLGGRDRRASSWWSTSPAPRSICSGRSSRWRPRCACARTS